MLVILMTFALLTDVPTQASPAQQGPETARREATPAAERDEDNKVVCRRERLVGSNRFRRVCRTQAEIEMRRERTQQDLERRLDYEQNPEGGR